MGDREKCQMCNGTGNAGHTCIAADGDLTGCLRCGGAGYVDWRNDVLRATVVILLFGFILWLVMQR